jgi:hypothetical protein
MARGTQFSALVTRVRNESGRASEVSLGTSDSEMLKSLVNRVYKTLYYRYDWPFLRTVFPKKAIVAGSRYYDMPANLDVERVEQAKCWFNGIAYNLEKGIDIEDYNIWDPDNDERSDPILKWDYRYVEEQSAEQIEVWPLPGSAQEMQFIGIRRVTTLVNDQDTCLLDDDLVVLYAAAEVCAAEKREDKDIKAQAAKSHFDYLTGQMRKAVGGRYRLGLGVESERPNNRAIVRIAGT